MGVFPSIEVVGTYIQTNVGWGGPKVITSVVLWPKHLTEYFPKKGWSYVGIGK